MNTTNRLLIICALRSHALDCIDKALQARAKANLESAGKLASESTAAWRLASEMEAYRDSEIDSNGSFQTAPDANPVDVEDVLRHERTTTGVDRRHWSETVVPGAGR